MDPDADLGLADELRALWQAAVSRPMHSPSCGCAVPSMVRIDPHFLELDLLDYVEHKHKLGSVQAWRDAVDRREKSPSGSLADWLSSARNTHLSPELHAAVVTDIARSLADMAAHASSRLAPAGSLGSGWLANRNNNPPSDR